MKLLDTPLKLDTFGQTFLAVVSHRLMNSTNV